MKRRVITTQVTATEEAQIVAVLISMLGPLGTYGRQNILRAVLAYFSDPA
jgi:hypothetical protein